MIKFKVTGQGQMKNLFLEHKHHSLGFLLYQLAQVCTINSQCIANINKIFMVKVSGQGHMETLFENSFLKHNFQILYLIFISYGACVHMITRRCVIYMYMTLICMFNVIRSSVFEA